MGGTEPEDSVCIQCQQHLMVVISVILAISKDTAREKMPVETWGVFLILASQHLPCHPSTHAIEPPRLGGLKVGQGGQAAIAPQSCKGEEEQEEERAPVGNSSCTIPQQILQAGLNTAETGQV